MRKAKSPYQKHGKTPYRYSDALRALHKALVERLSNVEDLREQHNKYLRNIGWRPDPVAVSKMKGRQREFWDSHYTDTEPSAGAYLRKEDYLAQQAA